MELVTLEIETALKELSIPLDNFRMIGDPEGKKIFEELLNVFVTGGDRRWWWEAFSQPDHSIEFPDGQGYKVISDFLPEKTNEVWFVAEEDQLPYYPVYIASPNVIQSVLAECYGFEYYIASMNKDWLLCENHHNRIIGVGSAVIERMKSWSA